MSITGFTSPKTTAQGGTVTHFIGGTFVYTPELDYHGPDSFTYDIQDGNGGTKTDIVVSINVKTVNDPPTAVGDALNIDEDPVDATNAPKHVEFNVLDGSLSVNSKADFDVDNEVVTFVTHTKPASFEGMLVSNGDGTFTYLPTQHFNGAETFDYIIRDAAGDRDTGMVTITVKAVNDKPVANADSTDSAGGNKNGTGQFCRRTRRHR